MKYTIYQVKEDKLRQFGFMGWKKLQEYGGPDMANYSKVYEGTIADSLPAERLLEELFRKFNLEHPEDYRGRSLSVGDIVVLEDGDEAGVFYCDHLGWKQIS